MTGEGSLDGKRYGLSKSRLTSLDQCERKLWLSVHRRDLGQRSPGADQQLEVGHEVGAIACSLYPDGIMIAGENLAAAAETTRRLISEGTRVPLFEATFSHDGLLVQVDILEPVGDQAWAIAEVKSSTGTKDYHRADLATQIWVLRECGLEIAEASIRHIDNQFRLETPGDYRGLFKDYPLLEELTDQVQATAARVLRARNVLAATEPAIQTGNHCSTPFECEYRDYCSSFEPAPPEWPVKLLPRTGNALAAKFAALGARDLREIERDDLDNPIHRRIHAATVTGETYHDHEGASEAITDWAAPYAFLDFETIAPAVPRWVGTRPYQAVPFQFSCHLERSDGELEHFGFLSLGGTDPRAACAQALVAALGNHRGAVVAYNASFERGCIKGLAADCPGLAGELLEIHDRVVDLLPVTRNHYYHRDQRGSWSIKAVLKTIAPELSYDNLPVSDGTAAQLAWLEAASISVPSERRDVIRAALETYCERDTHAMVVLLRRVCSPPAN
ncbi:DUF2779 domain-containing protein [Brevundimonas sp.]|uniref:DUF2779 domain-containing protein n=1 Tax=Brevundimonas sp. TaxID=1871086 RepID=UPI002609D4BE|nr:DUF2779 domain-containing protein [Brevundimonas sp.]